jgi:hypothetical protein
VAQFAAQLEQYPKAVEIYEEIAKSSLDSNLLRYSVKGYLLNAGLCHLATGDVVNIRNAIDKYQELDLSFSGTRECKFLQVGALEIDLLGVLTIVELDVASSCRWGFWSSSSWEASSLLWRLIVLRGIMSFVDLEFFGKG